MEKDFIENCMSYCFSLAVLGRGKVKTNPMVGAILVNDHRIIGQGYHRQYGQAHAEVEAINHVRPEFAHLISESTLFVSLEPCNHWGKTGPCSDFILSKGIKKLVYSCTDPNPEMQGKSITYLKSKGVEVIGPVLEKEGRELIKSFKYQQTHHRPYVILKIAQSQDFFMGRTGETIKITSSLADVWIHKLRSQADAIGVGKNTLLTDKPLLTNRHWPGGPSPIRLYFGSAVPGIEKYPIYSNDDLYLELPDKLRMTKDLSKILSYLYSQKIGDLLIEGGANLIQSFIEQNVWQEAIIIQNHALKLQEGISTPHFEGRLVEKQEFGTESALRMANNAF